jgi:hypothetical protein
MPYLILFGIALALRLLTATVVYQPGFVDAYYYYEVAANWHAGRGFSAVTVWNYQVGGDFTPAMPGDLSHPAFTYWQPLATVLAGLPMFLFGANFWAGSALFILCGAALPPVAYWLGQLLFGTQQTRYSWLMAVVMLFPGRYFLFWNTPDNFAPFALITMLMLAAIYGGLYHNDRWLIAAGALGGLAYLSRNDGILLTATLVLCYLWRCWRAEPDEKLPRFKMLVAGLGVALLVVAPWLARNTLQFGTPLPSNSTKMLFLRDYLDFFSYSLKPDLNYYLGWGIGNIFSSKLNALGVNALLIIFQGLFLLGFPFVIGLIPTARKPTYFPFFVYTLLLYLTMALLFTEIGSQGTLFHSAGGLLPFQAGAALAALEWLGRDKPRPGGAVILGLVAAGVTLYFVFSFGISEWNTDYQNARALESWFANNAAPKDVIMIGEPLSFHYATGRPAIAQASDGLVANLAAARRYGARYGGLESLERDGGTTGEGVEFRLFARLENGTQIFEVKTKN